MTDQDTYVTFQDRFGSETGKIALRLFEGLIHAYPMRGFEKRGVGVPIGMPMCAADIRFMAAQAMPTADAPSCGECLAAMRKALGRK